MTISADARALIIPGKVEIFLAHQNAYTTLFYLGEVEDGLEVQKQPHFYSVKGDSQGGHDGPDIEKQFLGYTASFKLMMSKWSPAEIAKIENIGGLLTTNGKIPDAAIGAPVLAARGTRVLLYCTRDTTQSVNFPCCMFEEPQTQGKQTKYSRCGLGVSAYRAPVDYWYSTAARVCWDNDVSGMT